MEDSLMKAHYRAHFFKFQANHISNFGNVLTVFPINFAPCMVKCHFLGDFKLLDGREDLSLEGRVGGGGES